MHPFPKTTSAAQLRGGGGGKEHKTHDKALTVEPVEVDLWVAASG